MALIKSSVIPMAQIWLDGVVFLGAKAPGVRTLKCKSPDQYPPVSFIFNSIRAEPQETTPIAPSTGGFNKEKQGQCRNPINQLPGEVRYRFPDSIEHRTKDLHGSVLVMVSPKDLIPGTRKMREEFVSKLPVQ